MAGVGRYSEGEILHKGTTQPSVGRKVNVQDYRTLSVEISGDSTSRNINFVGVGPGGGLYALPATLKSLAATEATSTSGTDEVWLIDIEGMIQAYCDITSVSGGSVGVNITGKLVR